ncbi:cache domain-containing protein [bacterium]|nr:cache domain-containing protein [bacterium]
MKVKAIVAGICVICLITVGCSQIVPKDDLQNFKYKETRQLVEFVRKAALLIEQKGESAFKKLRSVPWYSGEQYIFVTKLDGVEVLNPAFPEIEGKNLMDLEDSWGKRIVKNYIQEVSGYGHKTEGWTHYLWPKPGSKKESWKTTYLKLVKSPDGKKYIVGSGLYDMKVEPGFAVDEVKDACELIKQNGEEAFEIIRAKDREFYFKDTYVFVDTMDGLEIVNPQFPSIQNKNIWNLKDVNGKLLVQDYINFAIKNGQGWVSYMWPKKEGGKVVQKRTYVKLVKAPSGNKYVVGCGIYPESE